ncbi:hypothetical protein EJV46_13470 [Roseococcus sp. SYP-B2431]|uniref:hypothetical protein n=1 Tax=Roseococcus sp. SYP-B2431 TaxID=2496640 RepID=UPI00103DF53B|nr:hypothetical protein [Roseococcus sp. SYP-B2431]TCH98195.1 hypothetical protein EJV46_13470 [Roseococcus sp. SYP-B2431]
MLRTVRRLAMTAAPLLCLLAAEARATPEVAAAYRAMEPLWRQVLAASLRRATWSARRAELEDEAHWATLSPGDRLAVLATETERLRRELAHRRAVPSRTERLGEGCVGPLRGCRVLAGGVLRGEDGMELRWQFQRGFTPETGTTGGLLVFERRGRELHPLTWSFEGYDWQAPRLVEHDDGLLLAANGFRAGSGHGNADLLYRRSGDAWREVELESWKLALPRHLPAGLGVLKGVDYDFARMTARMSLWRDADGHCCPTGGQALADLRLDGDRLVLVRLRRIGLDDFPG